MVNEREIDALLSPRRTGSIIDRLMAMPEPTGGPAGQTEWDRAVSSRLQTNLVRQMRALLGGDDSRSDAA